MRYLPKLIKNRVFPVLNFLIGSKVQSLRRMASLRVWRKRRMKCENCGIDKALVSVHPKKYRCLFCYPPSSQFKEKEE
jgi:hypothetical protein